MGDMKPTATYAYLAGSIDSDGFISIGRSTKKVGEKYAHGPTYYNVKIGFTSTDPIVPNLFRETFGGSLYTHQPKNPTHKVWHNWQAHGSVAGVAIKALLPHLRTKIKQGQLALEFLDLIASQKHRCMKERITPVLEAPRAALWRL